METVTSSAENRKVNTNALPRIFRAQCKSFIPSTIEMREADPTPTSVPMAVTNVINGKVSASPEMANGPTP